VELSTRRKCRAAGERHAPTPLHALFLRRGRNRRGHERDRNQHTCFHDPHILLLHVQLLIIDSRPTDAHQLNIRKCSFRYEKNIAM
jgi:hypothetical protein